MSNFLGISDEAYASLLAGVAQGKKEIAETGSIQPMGATANSPTKTNDKYVPLISATPDPVNGGNLTEYRAPRATDNAQMLQSQAPAPVVNTTSSHNPLAPLNYRLKRTACLDETVQ